MKKIILDLCGGTGSWSAPYKKAGYDVRVITLPDYNVTNVLIVPDYITFYSSSISNKPNIIIKLSEIYGILAAPPCTEFSFAKTNSKYPRKIEEGMGIVNACLKIIWAAQYQLPTPLAKRTTLKFWALENPFGLLRRYLGHPVLTFNPYDYGDSYQKKTCLWGFFNLPKQNPIKLTKKQKELHKTNSQPLPKYLKFDRLTTKEIHGEYYGKLTRQERRAITPPGFTKAFFEANR